MIPKLLLLALLFLSSFNSYAATNDGQVAALRGQVASGDYYAMYRLGRILLEEGDHEEGICLLASACAGGKEELACKYLDNMPDAYKGIIVSKLNQAKNHNNSYQHISDASKVINRNDMTNDTSSSSISSSQYDLSVVNNPDDIDYLITRAENGDGEAIFILGKKLYEMKKYEDGIQLIAKSCSKYKNSNACTYINKNNINIGNSEPEKIFFGMIHRSSVVGSYLEKLEPFYELYNILSGIKGVVDSNAAYTQNPTIENKMYMYNSQNQLTLDAMSIADKYNNSDIKSITGKYKNKNLR